MKKLLSIGFIFTSLFLFAQTSEQIIDNYFKSIGNNLEKVQAILQKGILQINGIEFPIENYQDTSGKIYSKLNIMGKETIALAFDGKKGYMLNNATFSYQNIPDSLKQTLVNKAKNIFGDLYNYKKNKVTLEYLGLEKIDNIKLQAVKAHYPTPLQGNIKDMIIYFNPNTHKIDLIKIYIENNIIFTKILKYKNFDGYKFPTKIITEMNGQTISTLTFKQIIINPPKPDANIFIKPKN